MNEGEMTMKSTTAVEDPVCGMGNALRLRGEEL